MAGETRWDLIVVGAGSAGAALAARSAHRGLRVLLLEAGPDYRTAEMPEILRPPGDRYMLHLDEWEAMLWGDLVATRTGTQEPQLYLRGRGVGGSSAINGQIAIRPPREDYDDWAADGCSGWSWEDMVPSFCRLETDADFAAAPYHGDSGPIPVWRTPRPDWGSVDEAFARAALASGLTWAEDVNAPGATGVSPYPINSRLSRRVTTNDGYLEPARELENLSIVGDALVDRVIMEQGRAVGVEVIQAGRPRQELADEIVLCAGAIHSPAILMRSGIGPAELLAGLEIDVVADLPVGQGLQDHPMTCVVLPLKPEMSVESLDARGTNCCARYSSGDPEGLPNDMMMVSFNWSDPTGASWPYIPVPGSDEADMTRAGMIGVWLNSAHSRGSLAIAGRDPLVQPVVEERMLADERDQRRLRDGVRALLEIAERDEILEICTVPPREVNTGVWGAMEDDRALDQRLLDTIVDTMHATSTCRMGPADRSTSVVDSDCRVLGVGSLRVADASIFPSVPRANTNLASIAVGEAVADRMAAAT
jgi:choline dehydrogenase